MARFKYNEVDNYGGGSNSFFSLKDDKDTAVVRFLYNDMNDVEGTSLHEIEVDGQRMDVECLRSYDEPISNCPLCEAGYKVTAKIFVPLYDENAKEAKIWTRGKKFFDTLSSLCTRFNPLVATPIELERCGKKNDTNTSYQTYPMQSDNTRLEDLPEIKAEGLAFQVKSYDELISYLNTGRFLENNQVARGARQAGNIQAVERRTQRETPATPVRRRPNYDNEENF